ncbi:zonadhesin-like isoform X1 [Leguminivora glycinivorella]|uniref:zonadhesin-like isoform X1 n=1 Tax=Leguminivora glycinivorella TaxID=1035111 RepID=UPI00200F1673|nr:zonadhesin-like isoform X1 [Leguminivora glycinivorella]
MTYFTVIECCVIYLAVATIPVSSKTCEGQHEIYIDCPAGQCNPKTCDDLVNPPGCPGIIPPCPGGCVCDTGYLRNENGTCIPEDQCSMICTKKHERYIGCLAGQCNPKTCEDLDTSIPCPFVDGPCPGGCMCEEGYLRKDGECIKIEDCPPKPCRGNQTWLSPCNAPCPYPRCPTDNQPPQPCTELQPCYPGCQCKSGYKRNLDEHCILASDCPDQCTKPHENWTKCYIGVCAPIRCGDLGKPIGCPSIAPPCAGGCICEHGFVRNEKGDCIDAKTCPNCGGDPNAEPGCGNPCRPTCANPAGTPAAECTTFCEFNACDCKEGYILNTDVDPPRCVYPKDCKNQAVH